MNTKDEISPGYTISALAMASGTDFVDAALGVANVLGGIAGPVAGIDGPAGDLIHPGLNVVVAGRDHAPWRRLEDLLLAPVDACQKMMRDLSHAASADRLNHLQFSPTTDNTQAVVDRSKAGLFRQPGTQVGYVDERRHLAVLRTPSFMLRAPDSETFAEALPEVMDGHAFLVYEDLFTQLLSKETAKDKHPLGRQLAAAVVGHDEFGPRDKRIGPGSLDAIQAHLLVTTTRDQIGEALAAANDPVQCLMRHSVMLEPSTSRPNVTMEIQNLKWGYNAFYRTIKEVLDARRSGEGFQLSCKPEVLAALHALTRELQDWCGALPAHLQPYFAGTLSLPYRLHWAFIATLAPREGDEWVLPFTMAATRKILERQRVFLDEILATAETEERRRTRVAMLWKLADKPLAMRELVRRFSVQKREVHEPVVSELVGDGLIVRHVDGRLELTPEGRREMAAA